MTPLKPITPEKYTTVLLSRIILLILNFYPMCCLAIKKKTAVPSVNKNASIVQPFYSFVANQSIALYLIDSIGVALFFFTILLIFALITFVINKFFSRPKNLPYQLSEPPQGLSPAGASYVLNGKIDERSCIASITNMAANGFISFIKVGDRYALKKIQHENNALSEEEIYMAKFLFYQDHIYYLSDLTQELIKFEDPVAKYTLSLYQDCIKKKYKSYLSTFRLAFSISLIITFAAIYFIATVMKIDWLIFSCMLLTTFFLSLFINGRFINYTGDQKSYFISILLFAISFSLLLIYFNNHLSTFNIWMLPPFIIIMGMFFINAFIFRMPILQFGKKRKILNQLESHKHYLINLLASEEGVEEGSTEGSDKLNKPDAIELPIGKLLPYAIALGVEKKWTKRLQGHFAAVLFSIEVDRI